MISLLRYTWTADHHGLYNQQLPKHWWVTVLCRNFRTSSTATRRRSYRRIWSAWQRRGWVECASSSTRRRASTRSSAQNSLTPTSWHRSRNVNTWDSDYSAETSSGICTTSYRRWPFRQWTPSSMEKSRTLNLRYARPIRYFAPSCRWPCQCVFCYFRCRIFQARTPFSLHTVQRSLFVGTRAILKVEGQSALPLLPCALPHGWALGTCLLVCSMNWM